MNIQLYLYKKNFDVQKALRFFKERRIAIQIVDMTKHRPGLRELAVFVKGRGAKALVDASSPKVREHPICYTSDEDRILDYLPEHPEFLVTPLIRDGARSMVGFDEKTLAAWIGE